MAGLLLGLIKSLLTSEFSSLYQTSAPVSFTNLINLFFHVNKKDFFRLSSGPLGFFWVLKFGLIHTSPTE